MFTANNKAEDSYDFITHESVIPRSETRPFSLGVPDDKLPTGSRALNRPVCSKEGTGFDLPIAVGILAALGIVARPLDFWCERK